ncbi:hypothetical protein E9228_002792 [Curtobacterium flaccumfaciens]|uniref:HK97 gp10 family phage protein n=1 Tax=Curtobacterium salicis TaxID=1779862 RepID=A0ABX0TAU8_9MICO|nr:hypothetical protein [Curtobacterium sp. WW7]NII42134.1 hypothetical protein [Curtobacterium sp. WW7]
MSAITGPAWSRISERATTTIDGRERAVIDHYGTIARVQFPGAPSQGSSELPTFDVDVSRTDVVDEHHESVTHVGPYLITVSASEPYANSTLTSINDLEQFGAAILAAARQVRKFLANEARKEVL